MNKLKEFFNREQNILIHLIATSLVIILGLIFKIALYEWLLVLAMIAFVITC